MLPLSPGEIYTGYAVGSVLRGLTVGFVTAIVMALFVKLHVHNIGGDCYFCAARHADAGALGLAAGIWSDKFDHIAAVTNFIVMPLTFLGMFYSVETLPPEWQMAVHFNPFFYMIDGFRSGFIGHADGSVMTGIIVLSVINIILACLSLWMPKQAIKSNPEKMI